MRHDDRDLVVSDWDAALIIDDPRYFEEKLKTLDELYQLLKTDQNNRWMLILEIMIVVLFIIDLALLVLEVSSR